MDSFIQRVGMFYEGGTRMKIKYIVEIGWREEFSFDNADAAMAFAIVCVTHRQSEEPSDVRVIVAVEE